MTALSYAAVHQVNRLKVRSACYADDGSHAQTISYLGREHPAALAPYEALMGKSRRTRYEVMYEADVDNVARAVRHYDRLADYVSRAVADQVPGV